MFEAKYRSGAVVARVKALGGGVVLVAFTGPVTRGALDEIKGKIAASWRGLICGVVADYCGAVLALSDDDLMDMMTSTSPENLPGLPAAVVVKPVLLRRMAQLAVDAALAGFDRRVFRLRADAVLWVAAAVLDQALTRPHHRQDPARRT